MTDQLTGATETALLNVGSSIIGNIGDGVISMVNYSVDLVAQNIALLVGIGIAGFLLSWGWSWVRSRTRM